MLKRDYLVDKNMNLSGPGKFTQKLSEWESKNAKILNFANMLNGPNEPKDDLDENTDQGYIDQGKSNNDGKIRYLSKTELFNQNNNTKLQSCESLPKVVLKVAGSNKMLFKSRQELSSKNGEIDNNNIMYKDTSISPYKSKRICLNGNKGTTVASYFQMDLMSEKKDTLTPKKLINRDLLDNEQFDIEHSYEIKKKSKFSGTSRSNQVSKNLIMDLPNPDFNVFFHEYKKIGEGVVQAENF